MRHLFKALGVVAAVAACAILFYVRPGATPASFARRLHSHSDKDSAAKPDALDDDGRYFVRKKTLCGGKAYTDGGNKCNGWLHLSEKQCRDKCTASESPPGCPEKQCFAAVYYKMKGGSWCHLFEQDQCMATGIAFKGNPTLFQKNMWSIEKNKLCSGVSYTDARGDKKSKCNGWAGITEGECRDRCASNAKAPFCPHEKCFASVYYPNGKSDKGWCHLFTKQECGIRYEHRHSSTSIIDADRLEAALAKPIEVEKREKTICAGHAYTDNPKKSCNGWMDLTEAQCKEKCVNNEQAPGCPKKKCFAATLFPNGKGSWCHLFEQPECSDTKVARTKATTFQKKMWVDTKDAKCSGVAYTDGKAQLALESKKKDDDKKDKKDSKMDWKKCNGFAGLTAWQCRDKCAASAQAPGCPQTKCYAAVHFPSKKGHFDEPGWCHLYTEDQCKKTMQTMHGQAMTSWIDEELLEAATAPIDLGDGGRYMVREKTVCHGHAYTDAKDKKCNGFAAMTAAECRDKCTANAHAANCPKKDCFAAVHYHARNSHGTAMKGWCHLFEKKECSLTTESDTGKPTTFQKNLWIVQKGSVCKGHSYTDAHKDKCNGFAGLTAGQCRDRCLANSKAPNCPAKKCYATVHYPAGVSKRGWCHLFTKDECGATEGARDGAASTSQLKDFSSEASKVCDGHAYTDGKGDKCNGFGGITEAECMDMCRIDAKAPNCPKKKCHAAVLYPMPNSDRGWCHLFTKEECSKKKDDAGKKTFTKEERTVWS